MSDVTSSKTEKAGPPKKGVSAARSVIGIVILIAVAAFAWLEYSAKSGYNAAVNALNARTQDENQGLLTLQEAQSLLGKAPDGPGSDVHDINRDFTKMTYSWRGLLKPYTLTAYYTKGASSYLHHFETEGATVAPEPAAAGPEPVTVAAPVPAPTPKGGKSASEPTGEGSKPTTTTAAVPAQTPTGAKSASEPAGEGSKPTTTTAPVPAQTPK